MVNSVTLVGNLTRDSELRMNSQQTPILSFSIAVNESYRNAENEWDSRPHYFRITVFGTRANALSRYLKKGVKVTVQGKLRQNTWEDKDGKRHEGIEVVAKEIEFMSRPSDRASENQQEAPVIPVENAADQSAQQQYSIPPAPAPELLSEDIPF